MKTLVKTKEQLRGSRFFILFLSALVALAPLSIDMYMPVMGQMATAFGVSFAEVNLTMSSYLLGNALGQFFGGSLSDQIGRKRVGVFGLVLFFLSSVAIIFSPSIEFMQWARAFQAIGGGFATVICIAQVRDIFPVEEVMKRFSNVIVVMLIAPMVAPSIGALLIQFGWQSIFVVLVIYSAIMLLIYILVIPETRFEVHNRIDIKGLFSGYWQVINHRVGGRITAIRIALYSGFSSALFLCFITNAAMIFIQHFKMDETYFAIGFASIGLSMIIGNRMAFKIADYLAPEIWLKSASCIQLLCCLALIAMNYFEQDSIASVSVLIWLIVCMAGSIMPTASGLYISYFDKLSGSAASLATTLTFGLGAACGGIAAILSNGEIMPVFVCMLVSGLIAFAILMTIKVEQKAPDRGVAEF